MSFRWQLKAESLSKWESSLFPFLLLKRKVQVTICIYQREEEDFAIYNKMKKGFVTMRWEIDKGIEEG